MLPMQMPMLQLPSHTNSPYGSQCMSYMRPTSQRNMPCGTILLETPFLDSSRSLLPKATARLTMLSVLRLFAAGSRFSQPKRGWFAWGPSMAGMERLRRLFALHRRIHTARPHSQVFSFFRPSGPLLHCDYRAPHLLEKLAKTPPTLVTFLSFLLPADSAAFLSHSVTYGVSSEGLPPMTGFSNSQGLCPSLLAKGLATP